MRMAHELCLATAGKQVPDGPDWIHEVKHDGYRIREDKRVRLLSRNGTDWTKRYPGLPRRRWSRQKQFVIDGEAVNLGVDDVSDFNALHCRKHDHEVQLYAFDILAMGGDDLRFLPLHMRKANLEQLVARRPDGVTVAPFERGEIGPDLFRAACRMGLEGLVSKHHDRPYRGGRQKHWIKVKNRTYPAMYRVMDALG
ncbi:DNA ligase [Bradyrhizobium zhanjiangense]|uniref:DNA ligase n=2 Tax=Bradyrhizobium zhanjiangense TaxID=1325107 RepID=A0A4Q0Q9T9_9BRAD|nr:RNA ligase family protein [Bradyrhizobium zhanjiangense]RXG85766.1 DNA ligase [Bradyrhizobium zhanjiangense]